MSDVRESLRSLTKIERPWAIRLGHSEEMSNRERIAEVTHQKWVSESLIFLSESLVRSFLSKKQVICMEIRWANSQPWTTVYKNKNVKINKHPAEYQGHMVYALQSFAG